MHFYTSQILEQPLESLKTLRFKNEPQNQGYNARKASCSCVYSVYILKPVLYRRNL